MIVETCGKGAIVGQMCCHTPPVVPANAWILDARSPENPGHGNISPAAWKISAVVLHEEPMLECGTKELGYTWVPWGWGRASGATLTAVTNPYLPTKSDRVVRQTTSFEKATLAI
jgi:hypothetical protein